MEIYVFHCPGYEAGKFCDPIRLSETDLDSDWSNQKLTTAVVIENLLLIENLCV